jgi:glycosyltransferase involved in cell wall biosynthesis
MRRKSVQRSLNTAGDAKAGARKVRVAFVNSHPIQYFTPLYAHMNRSYDIEAVPIFLSEHGLKPAHDPGFGHVLSWDIDILNGISPVFLPGSDKRKLENGTVRMVAPQLWSEIRNGGYDAVVLHGHAVTGNFIAFMSAKTAGIATFNRTETHLGLKRSLAQRALRRLLIATYYLRFDGLLAIGSENRDFYRAMGIPDRRISLFPYTVDHSRLMPASQMGEEERAAFRARIGLTPDRLAVLYVSKLQRRKHPDDLIRAAQSLASQGLDFDLVVAGTGEMEAELKSLAASAKAPRVLFPGFFNQSEMPKLLGACDIFVLPAENEPWGLIINEAMCAGLPIVAARGIGAVRDLVQDGVNGHVFDAGDLSGLAEALRPLIEDKGIRASMKINSRAIISRWNYDLCLEGLRDALTKAGIPLLPPCF